MARDRELEIQDDPKHHETYWRVQRLGSLCMLLVVQGALAGVFARGPLARAEVVSGRVGVEYARFGRVTAAEALDVRLQPPHESGRVAVAIFRSYLERSSLGGVVPEPESVTGAGGYLVHVFRTNPKAALHVALELEAHEGKFGRVYGEVHSSGATIQFSQFFWP